MGIFVPGSASIFRFPAVALDVLIAPVHVGTLLPRVRRLLIAEPKANEASLPTRHSIRLFQTSIVIHKDSIVAYQELLAASQYFSLFIY